MTERRLFGNPCAQAVDLNEIAAKLFKLRADLAPSGKFAQPFGGYLRARVHELV